MAYVLIPVSASRANGAPSGFASNLRYAAPALTIGLVLLPLCETRSIARRVILPSYALIVLISAIASEEWIQPELAAAIAIGGGWFCCRRRLLRQPSPRRGRIALSPWPGRRARGLRAAAAVFRRPLPAAVAPPLDNPGSGPSEQWQAIRAGRSNNTT